MKAFRLLVLSCASLAWGQITTVPSAGGNGGGASGSYSTASATYAVGTTYLPPGGGLAANATEANLQVAAPVSGSYSNLSIKLTVAPGTGKSLAFTFRQNGADTLLACSVTDTNTTCTDTSHSISVTQGDLIDFKLVSAGTLASGTYTSGGSITGSSTQTCTLSSFNGGGSSATATVALTGTNVIAGGTALTITAAGSGYTSAPTSATLGSGTATCSGTATVSTVLNNPAATAISMLWATPGVAGTNGAAGTPTPSALNPQSGTSYTFVNADCSKEVSFNNASPIAATLPQAGGSGNFLAKCTIIVYNKGAGLLTITPTTSTLGGASSQTLSTSGSATIISDGTNYDWLSGGAVTGLGTNDANIHLGLANGIITPTWNSTLAAARGGLGASFSGCTGVPTFSSGTSSCSTTTGTLGNVVYSSSPTIATPTISSPTITGHPTLEGVTSTGATGTGNFVFSISPTLSTSLILNGSSSGAITIQGQSASGTWNLNLPTSAGSSGAPLLSGGGGATAMTWGTLSGNTSQFVTTTGTQTANALPRIDSSGNYIAGSCTQDSSGNIVCPGGVTTGNASGNTGSYEFDGHTSGALLLTVPDVAGTKSAVILPNPTGATTGTFLQLGASTTCPTDSSGTFTGLTCYPASWAAPSGSGTVVSSTIGQLAVYTGATTVTGSANLNLSLSTLTIGQAGVNQGEVDIAGSTSGQTKLIAPSSGGGSLALPAGTDMMVGRATTDTLTNKTLNCFSGNTCTGPVVPVSKDTSTPVTVTTTAGQEFYFNQNATAATAVTYNLPTAAAGLQFCFRNSYNGSAADTGALTIATSATGQFLIDVDGSIGSTGGHIVSGGAGGDAACVVGVDATHWQVYVNHGTWTKN